MRNVKDERAVIVADLVETDGHVVRNGRVEGDAVALPRVPRPELDQRALVRAEETKQR